MTEPDREEFFTSFTEALDGLVIAWAGVKEGANRFARALEDLAESVKPSSDAPDVDQER
jgi:hypothetical protein